MNHFWSLCALLWITLPVFGKFSKPDPQRSWDWNRPNTLNLYQYVSNDPVNKWDPTGFSEKDVEAVLRAIDSKLNEAWKLGHENAGHERFFTIYNTKGNPNEITTSEITAAPDQKGGKVEGVTVPKGSETRGIAHTHDALLNSVTNSPHSGTDLLSVAGRAGTVSIVQADSVRYAAEVTDEKKGQEFKAGTDSTKVKEMFMKHMTDYRATEAGKTASKEQVQLYAALKIAEMAGITIYRTVEGQNQTDVINAEIVKADVVVLNQEETK